MIEAKRKQEKRFVNTDERMNVNHESLIYDLHVFTIPNILDTKTLT